MKRIILPLLLAFAALSAQAADKVVKLNKPNLDRTTLTVMQSYSHRQSTREFSTQELSLQDLSDLLWVANGINRADSGKRTAASAMNRQEVDIYVIMASGAYLYDAAAHQLNLVAEADLRGAVAGRQTSVKDAPVCLLLVSDNAQFQGRGGEFDLVMRGVDVGIVSQNISLFCAAAHLATVPRGSMEADDLKKALNLGDGQQPMLNHPVGYFK